MSTCHVTLSLVLFRTELSANNFRAGEGGGWGSPNCGKKRTAPRVKKINIPRLPRSDPFFYLGRVLSWDPIVPHPSMNRSPLFKPAPVAFARSWGMCRRPSMSTNHLRAVACFPETRALCAIDSVHALPNPALETSKMPHSSCTRTFFMGARLW